MTKIYKSTHTYLHFSYLTFVAGYYCVYTRQLWRDSRLPSNLEKCQLYSLLNLFYSSHPPNSFEFIIIFCLTVSGCRHKIFGDFYLLLFCDVSTIHNDDTHSLKPFWDKWHIHHISIYAEHFKYVTWCCYSNGYGKHFKLSIKATVRTTSKYVHMYNNLSTSVNSGNLISFWKMKKTF